MRQLETTINDQTDKLNRENKRGLWTRIISPPRKPKKNKERIKNKNKTTLYPKKSDFSLQAYLSITQPLLHTVVQLALNNVDHQIGGMDFSVFLRPSILEDIKKCFLVCDKGRSQNKDLQSLKSKQCPKSFRLKIIYSQQ